MASTMLSGGRQRARTTHPFQTTIVCLSVAFIALAILFTLWIGISLGANAIGGWIILPIALAIGEPMRRRLRRTRSR
ncbi:MAG: hypothetical protein ACYCU0_11600 [Solirubrobacteraceae bacterium]